MDTGTQNLGERIALLRKARRLTQDDLSKVFGVTNQAVSKWEIGACCPDVSLLPAIASYFGVSVDELLGREDPTKAELARIRETLNELKERTERIENKLETLEESVGERITAVTDAVLASVGEIIDEAVTEAVNSADIGGDLELEVADSVENAVADAIDLSVLEDAVEQAIGSKLDGDDFRNLISDTVFDALSVMSVGASLGNVSVDPETGEVIEHPREVLPSSPVRLPEKKKSPESGDRASGGRPSFGRRRAETEYIEEKLGEFVARTGAAFFADRVLGTAQELFYDRGGEKFTSALLEELGLDDSYYIERWDCPSSVAREYNKMKDRTSLTLRGLSVKVSGPFGGSGSITGKLMLNKDIVRCYRPEDVASDPEAEKKEEAERRKIERYLEEHTLFDFTFGVASTLGENGENIFARIRELTGLDGSLRFDWLGGNEEWESIYWSFKRLGNPDRAELQVQFTVSGGRGIIFYVYSGRMLLRKDFAGYAASLSEERLARLRKEQPDGKEWSPSEELFRTLESGFTFGRASDLGPGGERLLDAIRSAAYLPAETVLEWFEGCWPAVYQPYKEIGNGGAVRVTVGFSVSGGGYDFGAFSGPVTLYKRF